MRAGTEGSTDLCDVAAIHTDAVERAKNLLPDELSLLEATGTFGLLSSPNRLRLLFALSAGELCVCDICALLGVSKSSASHTLRLLRAQRLVRPRREGRLVYYSLYDEHVRQFLSLVGEHVTERL